MPSILDMLPPEAQALLGGAALLLAAMGLIVWSAGIKVARGIVAGLLGLLAGALAAWALPPLLGIATATAGLIGFVLGALVGAIGFRLLQGLTLAACLGLAVSGAFYRMHVDPSIPPPPAAQVEEVKASDLLIEGPLAGRPAVESAETAPSPGKIAATTRDQAKIFAGKLKDRWDAISATQQRRMLAAGIGTAAIALLLAFGFPRHTTLVVSAILGALMLLAGIEAALHVYLPKLQSAFPHAPAPRYALVAILALIGMALQHHFFWPRKKKTQPADETPAANPRVI